MGNISDKMGLSRITLASIGEQKIQVIKTVREITNRSLKDSKELVENLGVIVDGVTAEAAEKIKAKLERVGATIKLEPIGESEPEMGFAVFGKVSLSNGEPAATLLVRAYDRDLRSEQLLGESSTNDEGQYTITYTPEQFRRAEKYRADLEVRAYNEIGFPLEASSEPDGTVFNAREQEEINLTLADSQPVKVSEYERLLILLNPILEGTPLTELSSGDLSFIIKETEIVEFPEEFKAGADSIVYLSQSARRFRETGVPTEAFYGWARQGLGLVSHQEEGTDSTIIRIDLNKLLETDVQKLLDQLIVAIGNDIVPLRLDDSIEGIANQLKHLGQQQLRLERANWIEHEVTGKLIDAGSQKPLIGYTIKASDLDVGDEPLDLGTSGTDGQGHFKVIFSVPPENQGTDHLIRRLRLEIISQSGAQIEAREIEAKTDEETILIEVEMPVPVQAGEDVELQSLSSTFPDELKAFLEEKSVTNLAQLRKLGGLQNSMELPENLRNNPEVKLLQAHADLSLLAFNLDPDAVLKQNQLLIEKQIFSPMEVAAISQPRFLKIMNGASTVIGVDRLKALHQVAKLQKHFVDSYNVDVLTRIPSSLPESSDTDDVSEIPKPSPSVNCTCEDCVSAISPGAYLTDLMGYVNKNVINTISGQLTTAGFLEKTFHQPFTQLPINCAATKNEIPQVRVACEVLYHYFTSDDVSSDHSTISAEERLNLLVNHESIRQYWVNSYNALLRGIGTSWEDLKRATGMKEIQAIGNRVGIAMDKVKKLLLDQQFQQLSELALVEQNLEKLFGLPAFLKLRDVGSGTPPELLDPHRFLLTEMQPPQLYEWRLEYLQQQWTSMDFPEDDYLNLDLPIIDPDLIGPDDFREPSEVCIAFSVWLKRRLWIDELLKSLWSLQTLNQLLNTMSQPQTYSMESGQDISIIPWQDPLDIDGLIDQSENIKDHGEIEEGDPFDIWLKERHLTVDTLSVLADAAAQVDQANELEHEAWETVIDILVQVVKSTFYTTWIQEEQDINQDASNNPQHSVHDYVRLDPRIFWTSLNEPKEGPWSSQIEESRPLIDPELVEQRGLPDGKTGVTAHQLWKDRAQVLANKREEVSTVLQSNIADRFDEIMSLSLGDEPPNPNHTWTTYIEDLSIKIQNPNEQQEAQRIVTEELFFDVKDGFDRLVTASEILADIDQSLDDPTFNLLVEDLVAAHKLKILYSTWNVQEDPIPYWQAVKARVPQWRGGLSGRHIWQQALKTISQDPIIDPDIVSGSAIVGAAPGVAAFDFWRERTKTLETELIYDEQNRQLGSFSISADTEISSLFNEYLGITLDELIQIADIEEEGQSIKTHLEQLSISRDGYLFLINVAKRVIEDKTILDETWREVGAVLLQVWKCRHFAEWREEERGVIYLSPEFFKLPEEFYQTENDDRHQHWRVDQRRQRAWFRTLKARIEQKEALVENLKALVSSVEEQTLPRLRDSLIEIINPIDATEDEKAENLAERFLIDMQMSGCRTTTRVSMAIEVLQSLIFSVYSGGLAIDDDIDLRLEAENFDKEWKWMSSYASWKAAMGVFLYPEQILYPSLKRNKSPLLKSIFDSIKDSVSSASICSYTSKYTNYLKDIVSLRPIASCYAEVNIRFEEECSETLADYQERFFVFAKSGLSKHFYWSMMDPDAPDDYTQSLWQRIPIDDNVIINKMIGVAPYYQLLSDSRKIFIFFEAKAEDTFDQEVRYATFDLDKNRWVNEEDTLSLEKAELPGDTKSVSATLVQQTSSIDKPSLVLKDRDAYSVVSNYFLSTYDGQEWSHIPLNDSFHPGDVLNQRAGIYRVRDVYLYRSKIHGAQLRKISGTSILCLLITTSEYRSSNPRENEFMYLFYTLGRIPGQNGTDKKYMFQSNSIDLRANNENDDRELACSFFEQRFNQEGIDSLIHFLLRKDENLDHYAITLRSDFNFFYSYIGSLDQYRGSNLQFALPNDNRNIIPRSLAFSKRPLVSEKTKVRGAVHSVYAGHFVFRHNNSVVKIKERDGFTRLISLKGNPKEVPQVVDRDSIERIGARIYNIEQLYINNPGIRADDTVNLPISHGKHYILLDEAYYFLPLQIALTLSNADQFEESLTWYRSILDYKLRGLDRRLTYLLRNEAQSTLGFTRPDTWLEDPINPHSFYRTYKYTSFTVQSIIKCLLSYADSEFTIDTSESIARARVLYEQALDLLNSELTPKPLNQCQTLIDAMSFDPSDRTLMPVWKNIQSTLRAVNRVDHLQEKLVAVERALNSSVDEETKLTTALKAAQNHELQEETSTSLESLLSSINERRTAIGGQVAGLPGVSSTLSSIITPLFSSLVLNEETEERPVTKPAFSELSIEFTPNSLYSFCIPPNPTARFLQLRSEVNLFKIRNCMNIAGMRRELEPYAAPIDVESALPSMGAAGQINLPEVNRIQPTQYRYTVLVERATQIANMAQQTEQSFFSALQNRDQEAYNIFKARQDVALSREGVKLQKLRLNEAEDGVGLAELQLERSNVLQETYGDWLSTGKLKIEEMLLAQYDALANAQRWANVARAAVSVANAAITVAGADWDKKPLVGVAAIAAGAASIGEAIAQNSVISHQKEINILSINLSIELRQREYRLQHQLAQQDIQIGNQQIRLAEDRVKIVQQEQEIAELQVEQANDVVSFLQEKFTNVELYDWMSGVLEGIFRYYLQQGASMAKLAETQLAFERQEPLLGVIRNDYYQLPGQDEGTSENGEDSDKDRRGLTGSARLIRDITKLDQHAFTTDQRKQQLSMSFSLAQLDPFAFQQFRETGILTFDTPGYLFDRRFPGQYLRLIKRVRTSVIALVPPVQGISATLSSTGISRVVIGGNAFQTTFIRREPETISFTSPAGATGVSELNPNPEMLLPFEGNGVDTRWEFRMAKATNPLDYSAIADIILTIEYTALHNFTYQQQVQNSLDPYLSADRAFSFRQEFADAWYDLHNPGQISTPMSVKFETRREDFPVGIEDLAISHVLLYFISEQQLPEAFSATLMFTANGLNLGGESTPIDGVISTRRGNGSSWIPMIGKIPEGSWQLSLPDTERIRSQLKDENIRDILLVITYSGKLPDWPQ